MSDQLARIHEAYRTAWRRKKEGAQSPLLILNMPDSKKANSARFLFYKAIKGIRSGAVEVDQDLREAVRGITLSIVGTQIHFNHGGAPDLLAAIDSALGAELAEASQTGQEQAISEMAQRLGQGLGALSPPAEPAPAHAGGNPGIGTDASTSEAPLPDHDTDPSSASQPISHQANPYFPKR